jgi:hypothetical protein
MQAGGAPGPPMGFGCCWCCWNQCAKPAGRLGRAPSAHAKTPRPLAETTPAAYAAAPSPLACGNAALRRVGCSRGGRHRVCVCGVVLVQLHVEHVARRFTSIRIARALPAAKAAASDEKLDPGPLWRPRKAGLGHIFLALALVQCPRFTLGVFGGSEPGPDVNAADTGTAALLPPRKKSFNRSLRRIVRSPI